MNKYSLLEKNDGKPVVPLSIKNKSIANSGDIQKITRSTENLGKTNNRRYYLESIE